MAIFADRADAGRRLAARLAPYKALGPLILALPRGGVPVAFEVATELAAPLDLLLVRKIGAPNHEELGIGAVVDQAEAPVLDLELVRLVNPPPGYIEAQTELQRFEIERRRRVYFSANPPLPRAGRTLIIVDDGIATGNTARAALRALKRDNPARLILAVPVASAEALRVLAFEADEIVCLEAPRNFGAVGAYYEDFSQTGDAEVVELLDKARKARNVLS